MTIKKSINNDLMPIEEIENDKELTKVFKDLEEKFNLKADEKTLNEALKSHSKTIEEISKL